MLPGSLRAWVVVLDMARLNDLENLALSRDLLQLNFGRKERARRTGGCGRSGEVGVGVRVDRDGFLLLDSDCWLARCAFDARGVVDGEKEHEAVQGGEVADGVLARAPLLPGFVLAIGGLQCSDAFIIDSIGHDVGSALCAHPLLEGLCHPEGRVDCTNTSHATVRDGDGGFCVATAAVLCLTKDAIAVLL